MSYLPFSDKFEAEKYQTLRVSIEKEFLTINEDDMYQLCDDILKKVRSRVLWEFVIKFVRKNDPDCNIRTNTTIVRCLYEHLSFHPCLIVGKFSV